MNPNKNIPSKRSLFKKYLRGTLGLITALGLIILVPIIINSHRSQAGTVHHSAISKVVVVGIFILVMAVIAIVGSYLLANQQVKGIQATSSLDVPGAIMSFKAYRLKFGFGRHTGFISICSDSVVFTPTKHDQIDNSRKVLTFPKSEISDFYCSQFNTALDANSGPSVSFKYGGKRYGFSNAFASSDEILAAARKTGLPLSPKSQ